MVKQEVVFANYGFCPICEQAVRFSATGSYFRNDYHCENCNSIPRERALMLCLERFFPNFRDLVVHESSPAAQGASPRLRQECSGYIATRPFPGVDGGSIHDGVRCEDLEHLTFADGEIDLHVTQDVVEHVLDPDAVFREIGRTLRPGGAHIFTVPLVRKTRRSFVRAERSGSTTKTTR